VSEVQAPTPPAQASVTDAASSTDSDVVIPAQVTSPTRGCGRSNADTHHDAAFDFSAAAHDWHHGAHHVHHHDWTV
jgi:hypothetical protein